MADYLSREEILRVFDNLTVKNPDDKYQHGMQDAIDCLIPEVINGMEAKDVQFLKHGTWEEVTDYGGWGDTHYRCSVCGEEWYLEDGKPKDNNMNFCPRCGAKMDAEPDEPWQSE